MTLARLFAAFSLVAASMVATPSFAQSEENCSIFYAGQDEAVGSVCVTIDDDTAYLDYLLEDDWTMTEAHAWIGDLLSDLDGFPAPADFPYSATGLDNVTQYSVAIPITELAVNLDVFCSAEVFVSANGVVHKVIADDDDSDHSMKSGKDDHSEKSGKGDHSGKSDKYGNSEKSGKSDHSGKSGKGGYSEKSGKSSYSGKSGKGSYGKQSGKKSHSFAKFGKGGQSVKFGRSSYGETSAKDDHSEKSGKDYHSGKSGKGGHSGKSGKDGHSEKSSKDDDTGPTIRTEQAWAGDIIIGEGAYFSFTNDFCPDEPTEIVVPQGCYNAFMDGTGRTRFGMKSNTAFLPIGTADTSNAWLVEFTNSSNNSAPLRDGLGLSVGNVAITSDGTTRTIAVSATAQYVHSANVFYGPVATFANVIPLQFGIRADNTSTAPTAGLSFAVPTLVGTSYEIAVHAVVCPVGTGNE